MNNGTKCPDLRESKPCAGKTCPPGCKFGAWTSWSLCNEPCGWDTVKRARTVSGGSEALCGSAIEMQPCHKKSCKKDCETTDWTSWSDCSACCGTGLVSRTRKVLQQQRSGGKACGKTLEWKECNKSPGETCDSLTGELLNSAKVKDGVRRRDGVPEDNASLGSSNQ